jgi:hypothetical protein
MPCSVSIVVFSCKHSLMYKLGCTRECIQLCPPEEVEILCLFRYRWQCEDCHSAKWDKLEDDRLELLDLKEAEIVCSDICEDQKIAKMNASRLREEWEENRDEKKRVEQQEEIQWTCEWVESYGTGLWKLQYEPDVDRSEVENKLTYLKGIKLWDLDFVEDPQTYKRRLARSGIVSELVGVDYSGSTKRKGEQDIILKNSLQDRELARKHPVSPQSQLQKQILLARRGLKVD